jgi:hypothetical protein
MGLPGGRVGGEKGLNQEEHGPARHPSDAEPKYEVSPELERVGQNAHKDRKMVFTALPHHLNEGSLLKAFYRLEPKAAPGVEAVLWQ